MKRQPLIWAFFLCLINAISHAQQDQKQSTTDVTYSQALRDLHQHIGRVYPCFEMKQIDWKTVGDELLPQVDQVKTDDEFGLLCLRMVARMEDSHAVLQPAKAKLPAIVFPQFDPGFSCLIDDRSRPVIFHVDRNGPARQAGVQIGMAVVSINGESADEAIARCMKRLSTYSGYSSERTLRFDATRLFMRHANRGDPVELTLEDSDGKQYGHKLPATIGARYIPRSPVPMQGINDSADFGFKKLDDETGYLRVRRIREGLAASVDGALSEMGPIKHLIIDARGNSGGGFDGNLVFRNFDPDDKEQPDRPRFTGRIAILIDERCISAGEGWVSWFVAKKRAKLFGTTTAGASSRKETYTISNGLYSVVIPVRPYRGYLDRPIERRGIEPDVEVRSRASDLARGKDTVLEHARQWLAQPK
jgi:C-terminal processing protease CtpA/Prc